MKTAVLLENQNVKIEQQSLAPLAVDKCRVRIVNAGICSSDVERGFNKGAYFYPLIMGHELAGKIVETGKQVKGFKAGDRVVIFPLLPCFSCEACTREAYAQCHNYSYYGSRCHGGFAEYLDVNPWNILTLPDSVAFEDAAATEPLSVVIHALERTDLKNNLTKNPRVLIIGAGFLGLLMVQALRIRLPACDVTIIDHNKFKLDVATSYVNQTIALTSTAQWEKYLTTTKEKGLFDVVVEATGTPEAFAHSIALAKHAGKVVWMGNITNDLTLSKTLTSSVLRKELTISGTWNSSYRPGKPDDWKEALNLIEQGVRPSQLVTHFVSLDEVPHTLEQLYNHKMGKTRFDCIKAMIRNAV